MASVRKFEAALMKALGIHLLPKLHQDKSALNEVLANELLGLDGPRHVSSVYSQLEFDLWKVFRGYSEVTKSIATLEDISFYVSKYPYAEPVVAPSRYLRFHAEAYLSEVYILRERMTTLAKVAKRQLKKLHSPAENSEALDRVISLVESTLAPVITTRGKHTHEQRLADPEIERLDSIALFIQFPDRKLNRIAEMYAKRAERAAFRKWRNVIRNNNRAIGQLSKAYEKILHKAILSSGSPYLRSADA